MAMRIGPVSVPGPGDVLSSVVDTGRSVAGWGVRTADTVAGLPERTEALLEAVERLVSRLDGMSRRADALITRVDAVTGAAEDAVRTVAGVTAEAAGVVGRVTEVTGSASEVLDRAAATSREAAELVGTLGPLSREALPLAETFLRELSEREVRAAIRLVDQLPALTEHLESDIMPILATLDRVGPDITELLDVVKDVRGALGSLPVLGYLRRRATEPPRE